MYNRDHKHPFIYYPSPITKYTTNIYCNFVNFSIFLIWESVCCNCYKWNTCMPCNMQMCLRREEKWGRGLSRPVRFVYKNTTICKKRASIDISCCSILFICTLKLKPTICLMTSHFYRVWKARESRNSYWQVYNIFLCESHCC